MTRRTLVASWDAKRPRGTELRRLRPEFRDPQRWLVRIYTVRPDGAKDEHTIKARGPCTLAAMFAVVEQSIAELCSGTPTVTGARMDFFA